MIAYRKSFGVNALLLPILLVLACGGSEEATPTSSFCDMKSPQFKLDGEVRPFSMGFNRWPPDATEDAIDRMNTFLAVHGDLTLLHMDGGVPWPEALSDGPLL
jgi:hypothetical protein